MGAGDADGATDDAGYEVEAWEGTEGALGVPAGRRRGPPGPGSWRVRGQSIRAAGAPLGTGGMYLL